MEAASNPMAQSEESAMLRAVFSIRVMVSRLAFAAALGVAEAQEIQGHVHRTKPRRTGTDPSVHILIQAVQDRLGPARRFNL